MLHYTNVIGIDGYVSRNMFASTHTLSSYILVSLSSADELPVLDSLLLLYDTVSGERGIVVSGMSWSLVGGLHTSLSMSCSLEHGLPSARSVESLILSCDCSDAVSLCWTSLCECDAFIPTRTLSSSKVGCDDEMGSFCKAGVVAVGSAGDVAEDVSEDSTRCEADSRCFWWYDPHPLLLMKPLGVGSDSWDCSSSSLAPSVPVFACLSSRYISINISSLRSMRVTRLSTFTTLDSRLMFGSNNSRSPTPRPFRLSMPDLPSIWSNLWFKMCWKQDFSF